MRTQPFGLAAVAAVLTMAPMAAGAQQAAAGPPDAPSVSGQAEDGQSGGPPSAMPAPESAAAEPEQPSCCVIAARTMLDIEIVDHVSSRINRPGDRFAIRLAEPLLVDGKVVIPAGTPGVGEVIHATKGGAAGKGGELILSARYLELDGVRIQLRSFRYGPSQGTDKTKTVNTMNVAAAAFAPALSLVGFLVTGGNVDIPAGTRANAQTAQAMTLAPAGARAQ